MNIVVCAKLVPDPEDIEIGSDGSVSLEKADWMIGEYDLQAIEAGVRLVEARGGKLIALSAGPSQINTSKLKKDLLSRGPDELYLVVDDSLRDADTSVIASVLAAAITKLGQVDLVLCGEGSADLYFQQVGLQLGERLGWPTFNAISKIEARDGKLLVERSLEDEVELLELPLPAALSVTTDINTPRLPTMKMILLATKKTITQVIINDLGVKLENQVEIISIKAPYRVTRKQVRITGTSEDAARALVGYFCREGVL